jgi:hypothetical protein
VCTEKYRADGRRLRHNRFMSEDRRRVAARVAAGAATVFWGFLWFGLIDLLVVVLQDEEFHHHYLLESGWGLLFLVLVAAPLGVLAVRPGEPIALMQVAVVAVAVLLGAVWRPAWPQLWNGLALAATAAVLAWLGPPRSERLSRADLWLSLLVVLGLPGAVAYGAPLVGTPKGVEDITNGVSHYPMQASLAYAVVGLVALAAVTRSRLPAWTASFSALWLGVESVVYPALPASLGRTGGVLSVVWAGLVVLAVEVARRRGVASRAFRPAGAASSTVPR